MTVVVVVARKWAPEGIFHFICYRHFSYFQSFHWLKTENHTRWNERYTHTHRNENILTVKSKFIILNDIAENHKAWNKGLWLNWKDKKSKQIADSVIYSLLKVSRILDLHIQKKLFQPIFDFFLWNWTIFRAESRGCILIIWTVTNWYGYETTVSYQSMVKSVHIHFAS